MKRIIILGAAEDQVLLIDKARSMGLETHVFDMNSEAPGARSADVFYPVSFKEFEPVMEAAERIRPDGICTSASDVAVSTVSIVAQRLGLPANSPETARLVTEKFPMRRALTDAGIACPKAFRLGSDESPSSYGSDFPAVVKPGDRSGSRGVCRVECLEELKKAVERAREVSFSGEVVIEESIPGRQFDVQSISFQGRHVCLSTIEEFYENPPYFIGRQHLVPSPVSALLERQLKETARRALDALGFQWGASHCEMRLDPTGVLRVIEVGGRMGGDFWPRLVETATGLDYLSMLVETTLGREPVIHEREYQRACLLRYVFEDRDYEILAYLKNRYPDLILESCVPCSPKPGPVVDTFQKVGHFLLAGPSPEQCLRLMSEAGNLRSNPEAHVR